MRFIRAAAVAVSGLGLLLAVPAIAYTASPAYSPGPVPGRPVTLAAVRHRPGWTWPVAVPSGASNPTIVRGFQPPAMRWETGHRGVDLLAAAGQDVLAAGTGTVSFAGPLFGRSVVAIDHTSPGRDTLRTTYEPVDPTVKTGQKVKAGDVIGHVAAAAALPSIGHCPPRVCLHWGLVRGHGHEESYLDPTGLVAHRAVRLLPVWGR